MKVTIFRIQLNQLWNSEYSIFVSQLVAIFLKYQPELLHLKKAFDRIIAFLPDLAKIKAMELSSAISKQLQEYDKERDAILYFIIDQVKNMGKLTLASIVPHVVVLKRFLDIHGRDMASANYNSETKRVNDMLADYKAKDDVKTAVAALNLIIFFDQLEVVNNRFAELFLQRTEEDASLEKIDARSIRRECDKTLTEFFQAFEFCSTEYEDLDYKSPANEMNDLIAYYTAQLKSRNTRRNAGKDVHTEDPIPSPS